MLLKPNIFCHYNCGRLAYYIFDNGKACCESNIGRCPTIRRKKSASLVESKKRKKRIGIVLDSNAICDYGCEQHAYYFFGNGKVCCENHSEKCLGQKRTCSDHHSFGKPGWNRGLTAKDHPGIAAHSKKMKGREQSEEHKRKKGFQPGHEPSEKTKNKQSASAMLRANKLENKEKFLELMNSPEAKEKRALIDWTEVQKENYRKNPDRAKNHSKTLKKKYADGEIRPWAEGQTKETNESLARASEKKKGQKSWIKGLTKDDPRVASLADKVRKDRIIVSCDWCGKELKRLPKRINEMNFCNSKCHAEWLSENKREEKNPVWVPRVEIKCDWCGKKIKRLPKKIKPTNFCNRKHADRFHARRIREKFLSLGDCFHNLIATKFFRKFDKDFRTKGHYADPENGKKEFRVIGYSLDYINFDLKMIIEWDEESHYRKGFLKKKDTERQQEIQEHFSDFRFVRIRQEEKLDSERVMEMAERLKKKSHR